MVHAQRPVPVIFDTDIGNDVDDALALGVIHALESRGECRLLAVTVTKDHELSAPFVDVVNTFYGRGDIPLGVVRRGVTPEPSKFTALANVRDGKRLRYPHDLLNGADAPEAVAILRQALAGVDDSSVVIIQVGFSTNLARLLASETDAASPMSGMELVRAKVRLLSIMGGAFASNGAKPTAEYNIKMDVGSAQALARRWPTPIVFSGFEIGVALPYPAESIEQDFGYVVNHPLAEAYRLYEPPPHNRPTWDLTSVLYAVRPERGYFELSPPGQVHVADDATTTFTPRPNGSHRVLRLNSDQAGRTLEALVQLASQPPDAMRE
jgi:inosine-uridine nucleoside N-ribohydrolase